MRRVLVVAATALAILGAGSLAPRGAMALAPGALARAQGPHVNAERTAYVCNRFWACGYYGCGWRRSCYWTPRYYYGPRYRPYYRPYWRPYWRRYH